MGLLDRIAGRLGFVRRGGARSTGFAAAEISRLTASLASETRFINDQLRHDLRALRARSRQATKNNPFGKRFVKMVVDNVGGPKPFTLQAKVRYSTGKFDEAANKRIESAWTSWSRKGNCELTDRWAWNTLQRQMLQVFATDGEVILRKHKGPEYGRHGVQLQLIDTDRLDESKNARLKDGGAIHMGVEVNPVGKPVAYHLIKRRPAQWQNGGFAREYERVAAEEIIHLFIPEYAEQVRGIPPMYAALLNLVHMGAFEEAAVIAARVGAAQMGFIQSPDGGKTLAEQQGRDASGAPVIDAEPGSFPTLPPGYTMEGWNPKYPDAAIDPFLKAIGRGVAIGLNVAYHNLSGNMEGVNYSSARIAELDERDTWLGLQDFIVEHLHQPFYADDWLPQQVLAGHLPFELTRLDKYREVRWQGRRWAWVDPEKEVNAQIKAVEARFTSRTRVVSETGEDYEELLEEIAAEEQMAKDKNVELPALEASPAAAPAAAAPAANADEEPEAADGGNGTGGKKAARAARRLDAIEASVRALETRGVTMAPIHVDARSTINVPAAKPAEVNVRVEPQVHVPAGPAPVVNVETAPVTVRNDVQPADVNVTIEHPLEVNVQLPARKSVSEIERDARTGDIKRVTQVEDNA